MRCEFFFSRPPLSLAASARECGPVENISFLRPKKRGPDYARTKKRVLRLLKKYRTLYLFFLKLREGGGEKGPEELRIFGTAKNSARVYASWGKYRA
jgi:hypothetical protein